MVVSDQALVKTDSFKEEKDERKNTSTYSAATVAKMEQTCLMN